MAFSPQGGTVTPPATPVDPTQPNDLATLLGRAGAIAKKGPLDLGRLAHYSYHVLTLRAGINNTSTIYWGFGRSDGAVLSTTNAAGYLTAKDSIAIDAVNGVASLESMQVIGNGTDTLLISFWE